MVQGRLGEEQERRLGGKMVGTHPCYLPSCICLWLIWICHISIQSYPSGNLYSGEWRNNLRHGEGTMRWIHLHQQYVGMWQNGVQVLQNSVHILSHRRVRLLSGQQISIHFKVFALNPRISLFWQHGQGTHFWNTSQGEGGHFFLSSRYSGEFVQGQRHGHGKVCFASGATYVGEWKHDKNQEKVQLLQSGLFKVWMPPTNVSVRVTQGKFTSADGRVFEGDRVYDQIMAQCLNSNRDLNPLSGKALQQFEYAPLSQPGHHFRSAFLPCFYTRPDAEH